MSKEEVRAALRRMNCEKAVGQDGIPLEVWRCLGNSAQPWRMRGCLMNGERVYRSTGSETCYDIWFRSSSSV